MTGMTGIDSVVTTQKTNASNASNEATEVVKNLKAVSPAVHDVSNSQNASTQFDPDAELERHKQFILDTLSVDSIPGAYLASPLEVVEQWHLSNCRQLATGIPSRGPNTPMQKVLYANAERYRIKIGLIFEKPMRKSTSKPTRASRKKALDILQLTKTDAPLTEGLNGFSSNFLTSKNRVEGLKSFLAKISFVLECGRLFSDDQLRNAFQKLTPGTRKIRPEPVAPVASEVPATVRAMVEIPVSAPISMPAPMRIPVRESEPSAYAVYKKNILSSSLAGVSTPESFSSNEIYLKLAGRPVKFHQYQGKPCAREFAKWFADSGPSVVMQRNGKTLSQEIVLANAQHCFMELNRIAHSSLADSEALDAFRTLTKNSRPLTEGLAGFKDLETGHEDGFAAMQTLCARIKTIFTYHGVVNSNSAIEDVFKKQTFAPSKKEPAEEASARDNSGWDVLPLEHPEAPASLATDSASAVSKPSELRFAAETSRWNSSFEKLIWHLRLPCQSLSPQFNAMPGKLLEKFNAVSDESIFERFDSISELSQDKLENAANDYFQALKTIDKSKQSKAAKIEQRTGLRKTTFEWLTTIFNAEKLKEPRAARAQGNSSPRSPVASAVGRGRVVTSAITRLIHEIGEAAFEKSEAAAAFRKMETVTLLTEFGKISQKAKEELNGLAGDYYLDPSEQALENVLERFQFHLGWDMSVDQDIDVASQSAIVLDPASEKKQGTGFIDLLKEMKAEQIEVMEESLHALPPDVQARLEEGAGLVFASQSSEEEVAAMTSVLSDFELNVERLGADEDNGSIRHSDAGLSIDNSFKRQNSTDSGDSGVESLSHDSDGDSVVEAQTGMSDHSLDSGEFSSLGSFESDDFNWGDSDFADSDDEGDQVSTPIAHEGGVTRSGAEFQLTPRLKSLASKLKIALQKRESMNEPAAEKQAQISTLKDESETVTEFAAVQRSKARIADVADDGVAPSTEAVAKAPMQTFRPSVARNNRGAFANRSATHDPAAAAAFENEVWGSFGKKKAASAAPAVVPVVQEEKPQVVKKAFAESLPPMSTIKPLAGSQEQSTLSRRASTVSSVDSGDGEWTDIDLNDEQKQAQISTLKDESETLAEFAGVQRSAAKIVDVADDGVVLSTEAVVKAPVQTFRPSAARNNRGAFANRSATHDPAAAAAFESEVWGSFGTKKAAPAAPVQALKATASDLAAQTIKQGEKPRRQSRMAVNFSEPASKSRRQSSRMAVDFSEPASKPRRQSPRMAVSFSKQAADAVTPNKRPAAVLRAATVSALPPVFKLAAKWVQIGHGEWVRATDPRAGEASDFKKNSKSVHTTTNLEKISREADMLEQQRKRLDKLRPDFDGQR